MLKYLNLIIIITVLRTGTKPKCTFLSSRAEELLVVIVYCMYNNNTIYYYIKAHEYNTLSKGLHNLFFSFSRNVNDTYY